MPFNPYEVGERVANPCQCEGCIRANYHTAIVDDIFGFDGMPLGILPDGSKVNLSFIRSPTFKPAVPHN